MSRQSDLEAMPELELVRSNRAEMFGDLLERLIAANGPRQVEYLHDLALRFAPIIEANMPPTDGDQEDVPVEWPGHEADCLDWPDERLLGLMRKAGGGGVVERTFEARYGPSLDRHGNRKSESYYSAMELAHFYSMTFSDQTERQRRYCVGMASATLDTAIDGMPSAHDPRLN